MPRTAHHTHDPFTELEEAELLAILDAPDLPREEKLARIAAHCAEAPNAVARLLGQSRREAKRLRRGLNEAEDNLHKAKRTLEEYSAPPWFPAIVRGLAVTDGETRALVQQNGTRRYVRLCEGLDPATLKPGDEVLLNRELNLVMSPAPPGFPRTGELGQFVRLAGEARLVVRRNSEEVVLEAGAAVVPQALKAGALVLFDRDALLAIETFENSTGREFLLENISNVDSASVGGQRAALETLTSSLTATFAAPEKARAYNVGGRGSILMVGPPGCGKTLMARVAVSEVQRLAKGPVRFAVIKPAEFESPFVGETEAHIRDCFRALREAAGEGGYSVAFFDEIESSLGRIRGSAVGHHSDRFLAAFLAELDGFADRRNVAIVAATNRKDLIDPALLERLTDVEVVVGRPDVLGAREIFRIHLPETLPLSPNGELAGATHAELIECAVSRLYSPNADNAVARLRFRDGREREVIARELISGRLIEQVCRRARSLAFLRDVRKGEAGIRTGDMVEAIEEALARLRTLLQPGNVHAYLADLPQGVDVIAVQPIQPSVPSPGHYLFHGSA